MGTFSKLRFQVDILRNKHRLEYSDIPFHYYRCIFFHIPKTGGVSISRSLFQNLGLGHINVHQAKQNFGQDDFNAYFKFTFVRNPYDRVFSAYNFLSKGGYSNKDQIWFADNLSMFNNFESFVMEWLNQENIMTKIHFFPQHTFISDSESSEIVTDFIGKYENIQNDFKTVSKRIGVKKKLLFLNKTSTPTQTLFTEEMKIKIIACYRKDFELFDYPLNIE